VVTSSKHAVPSQRHEKRVPGSGELPTKFEQGEVLQRRIRQPEGNKNRKVRLYLASVVAL
jgi:hypothetical protein